MKGDIKIVSIALGRLGSKALEDLFFTKKYGEYKREECDL
jgi:hypothetical protein